MSYYIYKMEIGDYFYYGSSKQLGNGRLNDHRKVCYNINQKGYNYKIYKKIRQLCPNKKHFDYFVDFDRFYEHLDISTKKYYENMLLQKYKNNPYSLNVDTSIQQQGQTKRQHQKERVNCPTCNKLICRGNISNHNKTQHK